MTPEVMLLKTVTGSYNSDSNNGSDSANANIAATVDGVNVGGSVGDMEHHVNDNDGNSDSDSNSIKLFLYSSNSGTLNHTNNTDNHYTLPRVNSTSAMSAVSPAGCTSVLFNSNEKLMQPQYRYEQVCFGCVYGMATPTTTTL